MKCLLCNVLRVYDQNRFLSLKTEKQIVHYVSVPRFFSLVGRRPLSMIEGALDFELKMFQIQIRVSHRPHLNVRRS